LRFILTGKFGDNLPHYARPEIFQTIKNNLDRFEIFHGLAEQAFQKFGTFDYFNLSNIFEYMDTGLFNDVAGNLKSNSLKGAKFAYWNLMVNRRMSEIFEHDFAHNQKLSETLTTKDTCFFYNSFIVDERK
jgi:S-adenosylmethionine-diacylglycerol 3-amino-3-carboxypropyl transferase